MHSATAQKNASGPLDAACPIKSRPTIVATMKNIASTRPSDLTSLPFCSAASVVSETVSVVTVAPTVSSCRGKDGRGLMLRTA
jgi:hypothetical protein